LLRSTTKKVVGVFVSCGYDGEEVTMQAGYNTATLLAQQRDLKLMMSL
jgi:hypothetical protein